MPGFKDVLAKRLKQARNDAGLTQAKLAAAVDSYGVSCTQSQIAGYENASSKSIPDAEKLAAIAKVLEKSIDWLCGMDAEQHEEKDAKDEKITSEQWLRYFLRILNAPQITEGYITTIYEADEVCRKTTRPNMELVNHIDVNGCVADFAYLDNAVATVNFYGIAMGDLFKKLAIIKNVSGSLPQDMLDALINNAINSYSFLFDIKHGGEKELNDFPLLDD